MRIAIAHPSLRLGGSEAAVLWAIEALRHEHDVTLATCGPVDIAGLNESYATRLAPGDFHVRRHPLSFLLGRATRLAALRGAIHARLCRALAVDFDLPISGYNVVDFGVPGIHLIADFSWDEALRRACTPPAPGWAGLAYRDNLLRRGYLACARMLRQPSGRDPFARDNLFLANSEWTAALMKRRHGVEASVLYPPVAGDFPEVPFPAKENGFVYIGRISPEKRIEEIITMLLHVRSRGHDIHLHIAGAIGRDPYGRRVSRLCSEQGRWVTARGPCRGEMKRELLSAHRFGINACPREGFGISVAELVKAGSIVFVPSEGGQAEIVAHSLLTFTGLDDAAAKIDAVLRRTELQQELCRHLAERGKAFSVQSFMAGIRDAVSRFLQTRRTGGHPAA